MERAELEALLDSKLTPLYQTIKRLEESQEKIVDILQTQARHEANIENFRAAMEKTDAINAKDHDEIFKRLRTVEKDSSDKMWDVLKMFLVALIAGVIGRFSKG